MTAELKVGTNVWVKSVLKKGDFITRKIVEVNPRVGGKIEYYLGSGSLEIPYEIFDLITDEKQAREICRNALHEKSVQARKKHDVFIAESLWRGAESSHAW